MSSWYRSTTIVRSLGTSPVASFCSSRYAIRFVGGAARRDRAPRAAASRRLPVSPRRASRASSPIACPNSVGRPGRSPCQKGIFPGSPGAGETMTRSCVISSMRQEEAPRTKTSPGCDSKTISSSSSPTRRALPRVRISGRQEHAVQPAVRDRPGVDDRDVARAFPRPDFAADPIPGDARPQLRELVRGIAAREHVEHALEGRARKIGEGRGAADERGTGRRPGVGADAAIATICCARTSRGLRGYAVSSTLPSCIRAVAAAAARRSPRYFGKRIPRERLADGVARAADPLHARRDRGRRLDLDDEIHRAHVDAELERGRRDDRRQVPALEPVLDLEPLLPRDRSVVREGDLLAGGLVERAGEPLGEPAAVGEDHRRAVSAHELDQARVDRRPDRAGAAGLPTPVGPGDAAAGPERISSRVSVRASAPPSRAMSSTGTSTKSSRALRLPASTISTGRGFHTACVPASRRRPLRRRAGARSPRAASAWRTARCAGARGPRDGALRASRAKGRDARRAWIRRWRGSRRRSRSRPTRALRAPETSGAGRATPAS